MAFRLNQAVLARAESAAEGRRILVLGATGLPVGVTAYSWDALPDNLNVADWDVVLLDLCPFEEDEALRNGLQVARLPSRSDFGRLIFSDSEVVSIGSLGTGLGDGSPLLSSPRGPHPYRADWWLPVVFARTSRTGTAIRAESPEWKWYFSLVGEYHEYFDHLSGNLELPDYSLAPVHPQISLISPQAIPLAVTRDGKAIGIALRIVAMNPGQGPLTRSGQIVLLPRPTAISSAEAIHRVLRQRYGVAAKTAAPEWASEFTLPNESQPRAAIERHLSEMRAAHEAWKEATVALEREGRFREMLYETGEDALEPLVRDAFRGLGAEVDEPAIKGREDGRMRAPLEAMKAMMLEIKGRKKTLKLSDVRELDQWVRDQLPSHEFKGVLVACLDSETPPEERGAIFPSNAVQFAERADICLMTTTQLYGGLHSDQEGQLDRDFFFRTILDTAGVCDLPELSARKRD
jgi:hypothetical protein